MSTERDFKAKLRRLIKPVCHIQDMSSIATNGTPDLWVSGARDFWLEVKYDPHTVNGIIPKLSALQRQWLDKRYAEGRTVYVLVGTTMDTGILYKDGCWNERSNARQSLSSILDDILKQK